MRICLSTYKITDLCSYNVFNNACWLRYWWPSIRFDAANKRPFWWLFVGAIGFCTPLLVMDLLGLWVNGSMQLYATCMHIVITRLCFKGSKGQSVEQTGAIVCDALTSDSTPQKPLDSMQFNATCMHNVTTRPNRLCIIAPGFMWLHCAYIPNRLCIIGAGCNRIDYSEGRGGGGQETFCCRGFGGANNLPGDFQTFSYTLNGSHSHTVGATKKGGVQNRFVGALFRVLVFKRALFVHFQGKREMHEKQHFDKTNTLCIQISLIL